MRWADLLSVAGLVLVLPLVGRLCGMALMRWRAFRSRFAIPLMGRLLTRRYPWSDNAARGRRIARREAVLHRLVVLLVVLPRGHHITSTSVAPAARRIASASARL